MKWFLVCCVFFVTYAWGQEVLVLGRKIELNYPDTAVHFYYQKELPDSNLINYRVIFLFSGAVNQLSDSTQEQLLDFVKQGGGLYLGVENEPFNAEGNTLLTRCCNKQFYGDFEEDTLQFSDAGNFQELADKKIQSGKTTVAFPLDYRFKVEAWSNDHPIILSSSIEKGKLLIDGGYSRFYERDDSQDLLVSILRFLMSR